MLKSMSVFSCLSIALLSAGLLASSCSMPALEPKPKAKEDPVYGVLEWMKLIQDTGSPEQQLLPDVLDGESGQTFNNALAALAFMLMDERERAERILDFYAARLNRGNTNHRLQEFYYRGEARGFYQNMAIRDLKTNAAHTAIWNGDRWMGDNAWLLMAAKHYEKRYGDHRYSELVEALSSLLQDWFVSEGDRGYVGTGWRAFDADLDLRGGHPEGNIDAYAVFRMIRDHERAEAVGRWLRGILQGDDRPFDCFTWKVQAFAPEFAEELRILETVPGYRKTLNFKGREVTGFTSSRNDHQNIWTDGLGHIACAYYAVGNEEMGDYYVKQMEKMIIPCEVNGIPALGLPYVAAQTPGYEWSSPDIPFVSCAAWYIMARHQFNPMQL